MSKVEKLFESICNKTENLHKLYIKHIKKFRLDIIEKISNLSSKYSRNLLFPITKLSHDENNKLLKYWIKKIKNEENENIDNLFLLFSKKILELESSSNEETFERLKLIYKRSNISFREKILNYYFQNNPREKGLRISMCCLVVIYCNGVDKLKFRQLGDLEITKGPMLSTVPVNNVVSTNNQLVLGTTTGRVYTLPDIGANGNFILSAGQQIVEGAKTFGFVAISSQNFNNSIYHNDIFQDVINLNFKITSDEVILNYNNIADLKEDIIETNEIYESILTLTVHHFRIYFERIFSIICKKQNIELFLWLSKNQQFIIRYSYFRCIIVLLRKNNKYFFDYIENYLQMGHQGETYIKIQFLIFEYSILKQQLPTITNPLLKLKKYIPKKIETQYKMLQNNIRERFKYLAKDVTNTILKYMTFYHLIKNE